MQRSNTVEYPGYRKGGALSRLALVFLLLLATQIGTGILCEDGCCADSGCFDWSCCVCPVASNGILTLPATHNPDFVPLGNVVPVRSDGRGPELVAELDRPPKLFAAISLAVS
jgi:hypothetical protein